jgi:hypothetical protein
MQTILVLSLLFLGAYSQTVVTGTLGVGVNLNANVQTRINYGAGASIDIMVDKDSQATLSLFLNVGLGTAVIPNGFSSLALAAGVGFTLGLSNGAIVVSANLTTPPLSLVAQQAANASARVGCLQFNAQERTFSEVDIASYSVANGFVIPLPEAGTYILVGISANVVTPNFYARAKRLIANARALVRYSATFVLDVTVSASTSVNVTFTTNNPAPKTPPPRYISLNAHWDIKISSQANVQAVLSYTYNAAELVAAGIKKATDLKFGFYNDATAQWEFMNSNVDVVGTVVSQSTTHFSTWGVYGDNGEAAVTPPANSASGLIASIALLLVSLALFL